MVRITWESLGKYWQRTTQWSTNVCTCGLKLITKTFLRHYNVRQRLLNSPIPEGFSYQPVFLEHPSAKSLHLPIITEEGVTSNLLTQKKPITSLSNSGSMLCINK